MPLSASINDNKKTAVPEITVVGIENPEADLPDNVTPAAEPEPAPEPGQPQKPRPAKAWPSVLAFVLAIAGWACLPCSAIAALAGGAAALIMSIVALRQRRGAWRNLALISIVAAAVLLLVLILFWGGLTIALKML